MRVRAFEARDLDAVHALLAAHGWGERITWVLRAGREGAAACHAALGFEPSAVAMERRRRAQR